MAQSTTEDRPPRRGLRGRPLVGIGLAAAVVATAAAIGLATTGGANTANADNFTAVGCGTYGGAGCALPSRRVDLTRPSFSNPTDVTNPLFPISELSSAVLLGQVDGEPFRAETTLLPDTRTVVWDGRRIETLVSQYTAYRNGRIEEVAIDRYAQADDGAVWYLGEDVVDYRNGTIFTNAGSWLAGMEGPAAMIMPGSPEVGDVFRPENILGVVFEEVRVKEIGKTVQGPHGPIAGAIVAEELHLDGSHSDKIFAPGRGEFSTGHGGDSEVLALAVPADALTTSEPVQLQTISTAALGIFGAVQGRDWEAAAAIAKRIGSVTSSLPSEGQPTLVSASLDRAVAALTDAVRARDVARAGTLAIAAAQSVLDLQLRYRPVTEIDRRRFELWSYQTLVDATARDGAGVRGDVATLEWIRDRFVHTLAPAEADELDARLRALRIAADGGRVASAADHAMRLAARLRSLGVG